MWHAQDMKYPDPGEIPSGPSSSDSVRELAALKLRDVERFGLSGDRRGFIAFMDALNTEYVCDLAR
jgi:hypothetical protein